ncbi:MAG TPA: CpaD family pilus assembly protein [Rhizomicrobium sp.]|nr:CpaD family pilus assembly protein [Rhizomicrobium sp.]
MTRMNKLVCGGALAAVLLAGSCAAPMNDGSITADPTANHPISVAPDMRILRLSFAGDGLPSDDAQRFDRFVGDYLSRGDGSISIAAPAGPGAGDAIRYFGERLINLGVARSRILVGNRQAGGDSRVEISYVAYVAHAGACGDWSKDLSESASNLPGPNFGCATQANLAAMVANPRDLEQPRSMGEPDAARRVTVIGKYQKGETTGAAKAAEQSANISQMAN